MILIPIKNLLRKDRKKILIVDDMLDSLTLLSTNFKQENYRVFKAQDGIQAYMKFFKIRPDIVFVDILLPKMRGDVLIKWIKGTALGKDIPIVVISGHTPMREYLFQLGIELFFEKPFKTREVLDATKEILEVYEYKKVLTERLDQLKKKFGYVEAPQREVKFKVCELCQTTMAHSAARCPSCGSVRLNLVG